ncbi:MAG: DUF58 domain-containing protein [Clostridia bacterium]|nr:DUF58 domain-containing protein [Clostridia bacterium]
MAALIIGLVIVAVLAERWSLLNALRGVEYDVHPDRSLVEIGEKFQVITELRNRSRRFIPFLRMVEDLPRDMETGLVTTQGATLKEDRVNVRSTVYLMPRQQLTRSFEASLPARGRYFLKGATLFGGDFLGLKEVSESVLRLQEIVVLPARWDVPDFADTLGGFLGDVSVNRFILEDPVLTLGFREYTGREPQKMISWPQTLRTGKMMVKSYDYTMELSVSVVLNVYDVDGLIRNHARMERAFSMTRGVVEALEERAVSYSFYTNAVAAGASAPFKHIPDGLGSAHRSAILEGLGRATYDASESFAAMADRLMRGAEKGRAHILITTTCPDEYGPILSRLREMTGGEVLVLRADEGEASE